MPYSEAWSQPGGAVGVWDDPGGPYGGGGGSGYTQQQLQYMYGVQLGADPKNAAQAIEYAQAYQAQYGSLPGQKPTAPEFTTDKGVVTDLKWTDTMEVAKAGKPLFSELSPQQRETRLSFAQRGASVLASQAELAAMQTHIPVTTGAYGTSEQRVAEDKVSSPWEESPTKEFKEYQESQDLANRAIIEQKQQGLIGIVNAIYAKAVAEGQDGLSAVKSYLLGNKYINEANVFTGKAREEFGAGLGGIISTVGSLNNPVYDDLVAMNIAAGRYVGGTEGGAAPTVKGRIVVKDDEQFVERKVVVQKFDRVSVKEAIEKGYVNEVGLVTMLGEEK